MFELGVLRQPRSPLGDNINISQYHFGSVSEQSRKCSDNGDDTTVTGSIKGQAMASTRASH
ncbi:hypothetical protein D3C80_1767010 [compost metagenome]